MVLGKSLHHFELEFAHLPNYGVIIIMKKIIYVKSLAHIYVPEITVPVTFWRASKLPSVWAGIATPGLQLQRP